MAYAFIHGIWEYACDFVSTPNCPLKWNQWIDIIFQTAINSKGEYDCTLVAGHHKRYSTTKHSVDMTYETIAWSFKWCPIHLKYAHCIMLLVSHIFSVCKDITEIDTNI